MTNSDQCKKSSIKYHHLFLSMPTNLEQRICYLANQAKPKLSRNSYLLKILYYYQTNPTLIPNNADLAKLYYELNEETQKKCKFVLYIPMDYFIPIDAILLKCISSLHYYGLFLSRNKIMVLLFYSYISSQFDPND